MTGLCFQVLEGLEAGQILRNLSTPLTIGREEDNDIQLNDERISRFHAKVQEDSGRYILTDLDSTNGTRVNGHPIRMRVLQLGDLIMVGRCVLLFGSPEELSDRTHKLLRDPDTNELKQAGQASPEEVGEYGVAFPQGPPPVPSGLSTLQTAELGDLLEYVRTELLEVLTRPTDVLHVGGTDYLRISQDAWRRLTLVVPQLARYISDITDPNRQSS